MYSKSLVHSEKIFSMTKLVLMLTAAVWIGLTASIGLCATSEPSAQKLVVGRVWTGDMKRPWAETVLLEGERIIAVGSRDRLATQADDKTRLIDAGTGLIVPGMIDSHVHLISGGMQLNSVQLRDADSPEKFTLRIAEFVQKQADSDQWVTGGDWDHTLWGGELPDRKWIDEVSPDTPVWVSRLDGHMALANTAAMHAAGLNDDVEDVEGGEIVRDAAGRPTGIFKDNAMSLIYRAVPPADVSERLEATVAAMDYLAARGVTAVHHMGSWQDVEVFRLAHRRGLLKTRIYACTPLSQWQHLENELTQRGPGDDWLRIGGLKGFVDGSLGSHTAAFLQPFSDVPDDRGLLVNTPADLESWTAAADKAGLQVAVHAIGDRANRLQLDIFKRVARQNGKRDRRFRVEHAQHIHPDDIPRFAEIDVIPSMQPYHAIDDGRWAERLIGPRRSETSYAFRSLLDAGALLAFGSDWFVAPPTPLEGIDAAVHRRTLDGKHPQGWVPSQKISVQEALVAYTRDAAYAGFAEDKLGTLEPGKLADLVILDRNIIEETDQIGEANIELTMVGGRVVYERAAEAKEHVGE